jgi:hypothetical protein
MEYARLAATWRAWLANYDPDSLLARIYGWVAARCEAVPPKDPAEDDLTPRQQREFVATMAHAHAVVLRAMAHLWLASPSEYGVDESIESEPIHLHIDE